MMRILCVVICFLIASATQANDQAEWVGVPFGSEKICVKNRFYVKYTDGWGRSRWVPAQGNPRVKADWISWNSRQVASEMPSPEASRHAVYLAFCLQTPLAPSRVGRR